MKGYVLKFSKESLSQIKTIFSSWNDSKDFLWVLALIFLGLKVTSLIFEQ